VEDRVTGSFVITGAGLVTAAGDTQESVFAALIARTPLHSGPAADGLVVVAIGDFDAKRYIARRGVKDLSRTSQLACSAAAANARGLDGVPADAVGVVFGSAWGSLNTVIEFEREAHVQGARFVDPILFTETVSNVPAGQVAILYGWSAFNATVSSGSVSGLAGVCQALAFLEQERGLVAVAGGGDELSRPVLSALRGLGLVTDRAGSLPLAAGRTGPVGGEGAAFLTIESKAHAIQRGARPLAKVLATGARFVPGALGTKRGASESIADLIRALAAEAAIPLSAVDLVVLSAAGSLPGDAEEAGAVIAAFGDGPAAPPVMIPKAILGETWGASGALAVALAVEALHRSCVPAAPIGWVAGSDAEGLHVPQETLHRSMRNALILDRTDSGHQLGLLLSLVGSHDTGH
jgi:3-oxoacyl-(acyl-carrier-protein) synthase